MPTAVDARFARSAARVSPVARARAGAARGGGRGSARAQGGKRGKPIQPPPPKSKSKTAGKNAKPPPPDPGAGVRPAGMRSRVSVRAVASGTPFADLRGGALLSPAARRDPEKAREERRKLWERLGANSKTNAGFAHLLETPSTFERDDDQSSSESSSESGFGRVGSGRGSSGTRQRGSSRATLRLGFTAHREKYAKALRLELEEEMARAEERLESWPRERLAKEGYALFGLRGLHDGNLQRDAVVRVLIPRGGEPLAMPEPLAAKNGDEREGAEEGVSGVSPAERRTRRRRFAMGAELPFHRFGQGDMVSLVEGDEHDPSGKNAVTGVVVERAMHFLKIAVDEEDEEKLLVAGKLRLDLSANTVSHDRALAALAAFSEQGGMPGYDVSSLQTGKRLSSSMYAPLQRAAIGIPDGDPRTPREARESVARLAATPPPWAGKDASGAVKRAVNGTRAATLNASQQTAVRRALTRTLSVWQGPPGTGKTRALCAFVEASVFFARDENKNNDGQTSNRSRKFSASGPAVLACAASNVAVDNIVDGLVGSDTRVGVGNDRRPLRVVRIGSPAKVQAKLEASTLGAQAALTPLGVKAAAIRAAARGDYTARGASARRLALQLETQAAQFVLRNADVVCATCVGAGDDLLEGFTFRVACVDEAAQCPEPAALIPITKALSAVLVGDAKQLPPTVTSVDAQRAGLGVSLFERMERLGVAVDLLDRQYRMHPSLAEFPSATFYGGRVASHPAPADRPPPPGMRWVPFPSRETKRGGIPTRYPVLFVEVDGGREVRERDGLSISNPREALLAVAVADALLRASRDENENVSDTNEKKSAALGSTSDVGIIAPYAAQVRRVRELWTERTREASSFERDRDGDRRKNPTEVPELEVHSVDGFQGREKEVIVLCTTRANDASNLGFVRDDRRMNVAMTRAKRGLIVLGNRATLASDPTWRKWLRWIDARGLATTSSDLFGGDEN